MVNTCKTLSGRYGVDCPNCNGKKANYLVEFIIRLALPLRFASMGGQKLEVTEQAFLHNAYAKQQHESKPEVGHKNVCDAQECMSGALLQGLSNHLLN